MKKLVSLLLALAMLCTLATPAFAADAHYSKGNANAEWTPPEPLETFSGWDDFKNVDDPKATYAYIEKTYGKREADVYQDIIDHNFNPARLLKELNLGTLNAFYWEQWPTIDAMYDHIWDGCYGIDYADYFLYLWEIRSSVGQYVSVLVGGIDDWEVLNQGWGIGQLRLEVDNGIYKNPVAQDADLTGVPLPPYDFNEASDPQIIYLALRRDYGPFAAELSWLCNRPWNFANQVDAAHRRTGTRNGTMYVNPKLVVSDEMIEAVQFESWTSGMEHYQFTTDDDINVIYDTLLRDYGKHIAEGYKWEVIHQTYHKKDEMVTVFNAAQYELGTNDLYTLEHLERGVWYANLYLDPSTGMTAQAQKKPGSSTTDDKKPDTGTTIREFTAEDEPAEIYAILLDAYGKEAADKYKWSLFSGTGVTTSAGDIDNHEIGPKEQYGEKSRRTAARAANRIVKQNSPIELPNKPANNPQYNTPEAQIFDDVKPGSWYYEAVNAMTANGLLTGYDDGLFHPDDLVTPAHMATVMCKIYGISTTHWGWTQAPAFIILGTETDQNGNVIAWGNITNTGPADGRCYFEDGYKYHWAMTAEITWPYLTGHYIPLAHEYLDTPLMRGQVLREIFKLYQNKYGYDVMLNIDRDGPDFTSYDDIPDGDIVELGPNDVGIGKLPPLAPGYNNDPELWAANHVWSGNDILWAYTLGITHGVDDAGTCDPFGFVTRAQFCQMLYNIGITEANSVTVRQTGGITGGSN